MADLGLMAGLAEGLKQGLGAYQDTTRYIQEQALKKRQLANQEQQQQAGFYEKGVEPVEGGGFKDRLASEAEKQSFLAVHKVANPDAEPIVLPEGMTANQLKEYAKPLISGGLLMQGRQLTADRTQARTDVMKQGLELRKDIAGGKVSDIFDRDPLIQGFKKSQSTIANGVHTIENPPQGKITNQMLHELGMEIAKGLSGSGVAAQGTIHEQTYTTAASDLAKKLSYITGNPEDVASPETVNYVKSTLQRLHESFGKNMASRAKELSTGREYSSPKMQKALEAKKELYTKPEGLVPSGLVMKGKVKVSNGKETLLIDQANLKDAMKDGYNEVK